MLEGILKTLASLLAALPPPAGSPPVSPPTPQPEPVTSPPPAPVVAQEPEITRIESSAYCHHGRTASGLPAGRGRAASNALYGKRVRVLDGPLAGTEWEVVDRHSRRYRYLLDVWLDCPNARHYGRRMVTVAVMP